MIRKCLFSLAFSLFALIACAQIGEGQWKIHPYYVVDKITNCVDVGDKVYYLVSGSLFCYDKASQTNTTYDVAGAINDVNITQIYYNYDKDYLFIAYDDCNIDIIDSDGTVVNISALKDVPLHKAKTINDITFADGFSYVATSFGYFTIEDETFRVKEVRQFFLNLTSVAQVGEYRIMSYNDKYYYCKISDLAETTSAYKQADNTAGKGAIYSINNNRFFLVTSSGLYIVEIAANDDDTLTFTPTLVTNYAPGSIQKYSNGYVASYFTGDAHYYTFDSNGNNATRHDGAGIYTSHESGNWWVMGSNGLVHNVNGVMGEPVKPNGISIKARAYWSTYDPYMQRVLLCRTAENRVLEVYEATTGTEINYWDGSLWHAEDIPENVAEYSGNFWIVVSPNEPNTYFFSYRKVGGVAKVQNGNIVTRYCPENGPISDRGVAIAFDSKGNLWMAQPRSTTADVVAISPQNQLLTEVNSSHFVVNNLGGACYTGKDGGYKRMTMDVGAGDTKVFSAGNYNNPLIIWNNNDDLSLNQYRVFESFFDQENKYYSTYGWVHIKADNDGMIWIGTVGGVISFDPREAFNPDFRVNRVKVTLDQGASVNETLLEGLQVNYIDVDAQNRKWIGTNTNGLYLVSADGSEIIKHFDMSNSPLPSDQIYTVSCNRATNSVLVVTGSGVLEYFSEMTPSAADYSDVYAYPNPVQSSFTGYVTIKGLMNNSTVVITDAEGSKVATLTSTGGVAVWDACGANGSIVKTGIYNVYAAQGTTPSTTGKPVAKIAVIK